MRVRRYAPLGRCMYCLATGVALTEEHLIPKALGGKLTWRDSVCEPCRVRTGRLEQATLDRDFAIPKTLLALKRRRARKSGPRRLPPVALMAGSDGGGDDSATAPHGDRVATALSAARYPRSFALPVFAPAFLLEDPLASQAPIPARSARASAPIGFATGRLDIGKPAEETIALVRPLADPQAFAFSLAKWAYALAVAERGLACCDLRAIRQLLAGERDDVFSFVGNPDPLEPPETAQLHSFVLRERAGWLTVSLGLFGSAGVPPYEIVIGSLAA